ncbi:hypothetical protein [Phyllobacterium leguminum]|uniref:Uncharacterized protein n=1 Tax=Phyllobacterium leguminum TaxID=314237 RepID=A0A318T442_9HYPH|nr:hypothetical protein [Phyllobacterium leguminum]PYE86888.1 hypothetical protein C7477_11826 [Phyllobacterium leguminum]
MSRKFSELKRCPVCKADLYGGEQTTMGYWRKDFVCDAEFFLWANGRVVVSKPCPSPSYLAALVLEDHKAGAA